MPGPSVRAGATSLSVALLLLAACSGGGKDDDESVQVIPFAADPVGDPGSSAELAPDDVPDCTQEDLVLRLLSPGQSSTSAAPERPASTGEVRTLAIEADAGVTCGLAGTPVVHLVPEEAAAGPVQADPTPPAAGRLLMSGRQHLVSSLIWPSSCAPEDADVQAQVDVTGATLEVPLPAPPACDPNQPTRAGAWAPLRAPAQLLPLAVSLVDPPTELPYGGTVEVVVEVRNEGVGPFQLDPCPQYRISFGAGASTAAADNHFNCAAAPAELGPDQSLRFAAELALPADQFAHDTEGTLGVELTDDYGAAARTKPLTVSTD